MAVVVVKVIETDHGVVRLLTDDTPMTPEEHRKARDKYHRDIARIIVDHYRRTGRHLLYKEPPSNVLRKADYHVD